ncbi:MAG: tRNA pseudouridine(55) synthase TruB [Ruminococcaceae bacterium]|nr:tRNA pseudouridine(55) synthase TruB [Oscillospiraceae bacterium]
MIEKNEIGGVLIVNKHAGCTSHDIVNRVRRLYGTKRVGHTGTLDPMATGVLVVLVGRAAKAEEYLQAGKKRYRATLRLGITTDTEDTTGNVLTKTDSLPSCDRVFEVCREFVGKIEQIPPMYSALKVGGKKLVDIARSGGEIERKPRPIEIYSLTCTPTDNNSEYILDVSCSGGTYIRTLCADIGARLGCGGAMASLLRTETCGFSIEQSHTVEELTEMSEEDRAALLIPTESLFAETAVVDLPEFFEKLCRSGCEIYQKKIGTRYDIGTRVRLYGKDGFFALGEVFEYENGTAIKAIKTFII